MTPDDARDLLDQLHQDHTGGLLSDLVSRPGSRPPRWLDLCAVAVPAFAPGQLQALLDHADDLHAAYAGAGTLWHEWPPAQVKRVGAQVMLGLNASVNAGDAPPGVDPVALRLRDDWLHTAAQHAAASPGAAAPWQPPPAAAGTRQAQVPVLLLETTVAAVPIQRGATGRITLRAVPATDACLRLVPAPASALHALTPSFAQALGAVRLYLWRALRHDLPSLPLQHLALAWDIQYERPHSPEQGGLCGLDGPSAGAALALAGLWALQAAAPAALAAALASVTPEALAGTWVSAALRGKGGQLGPVGGVDRKAGALVRLLPALLHLQAGGGHALACLHVDKEDQHALVPPGAPPLVGHPDMASLVRALAEPLARLDPAQQTLHDALLADGEPPPLPEATLKAVAESTQAHTLRHWLLRQWAQWEQALGGQVQARFVPLAVQADARGPGRMLLQAGAQTAFSTLQQLLAEHDSGSQQAYVLRGKPGAGKTTLLRHHLQQQCRQALRHLAGAPTHHPPPTRPAAAHPAPPELPLYLPLAGLPADADAMAWARDYLRQDGAPPAVLDAFTPDGLQAPPGWRLRLLLDGLNELKLPPGQLPHERAAVVAHALRPRGPLPLPMLLSIRQHHIDSLAGLELLRVDVQEWDDAGVRAYLARRFPAPPRLRDDKKAPWWPYWQQLQATPQALHLCRTPMYLAGQCDLWAAGYPHPVRDRAALYTAWLWQRLRRELGYQRPPHAGPPQPNDTARRWREQGLLTQRDCELLAGDHWLSERPAELPLAGLLGQGLLRQAEQQWWADAQAGKPGTQRAGEVAVPWAQVAPWLADQRYPPGDERCDDLRLAWARAAADLGLVRFTQRRDFAFSHQSWGEYLASIRLLPADPPARLPGLAPGRARRWWSGPWLPQGQALAAGTAATATPPGADDAAAADPQAQALRVHAECLRARWPGPDTRSDEAELAHLAAEPAAAWQAVPATVWQQLLDEGLALPLDELLDGTLGPAAGLGQARRLVGLRLRAPEMFSRLVFDLEARPGQVLVNLGAWAAVHNLDQQFKRRPGHWHHSAAAWQFLVHEVLWTPVRHRLWQRLAQLQVPQDTVAQLQAQPGRLQLPPPGDIDEVLGLALQARPDPLPWLAWLLAAGHWQRLAGVLPALAARLEPQGAWGQPAPADAAARAVLQHLRRLLLLHSVDAGRRVARRVRASGLWTVLAAPVDGLPPLLHAHWQQALALAFAGRGHDLRLRLQAGLLLGEMGDTLRYHLAQGRQPAGPAPRGHPSQGLLLHPALWVAVGRPGQATAFRFGTPWWRPHTNAERPVFARHLPGFQVAAQPVTVGEWRCFVHDGGYASADARWWQAAGPAAQRWLGQRLAEQTAGGRAAEPWLPRIWHLASHNNPLQPMVGITVFEALAYAAWANALVPLSGPSMEQQGGTPPLRLALPTELQWEAAARGPAPWAWLPAWLPAGQRGWAHQASQRAPAALDFNHAASRWARPSPVGVFSRSLCPRGLSDLAGNVWEWCSSGLSPDRSAGGWRDPADRDVAGQAAPDDDDATFRALRGGACSGTSNRCRPAFRSHGAPVDHNDNIGVRLVRV